MQHNYLISSILVGAVILGSCSKKDAATAPTTTATAPTHHSTSRISGATVLSAPVAEEKVYRLIPGFDHTTDFEASGVQYVSGYFYVACDNMQKIAKIKSPLTVNDSHNSLLSTGAPGSGVSNYEGITYDNNSTPNFYVVEESADKGGGVYEPRISEFNSSMSYQSRMWGEYDFTSSNSNKAFEGIAWLHRGSDDYILGLVEGTGVIAVLKKTSSKWSYVTSITLPSSVTFTDYSDIALYGNTVAITSQEDGQLWIGTLSSTSWSITGGTAYTFPLGSSTGVIGAGTYQLYGNVEGISFISSNQIVICSDKMKSDQPSYQSYKEMTVSVFNIP